MKQFVLRKQYQFYVGLFDRSYIFSTLDREQSSQTEDKLSIYMLTIDFSKIYCSIVTFG